MPRTLVVSPVLLLVIACQAFAADGNRLAYLDGPLDPYYPHRDFPKLITPQWVGEEGVECVVTLAIDDMRESAKYEAFLRPILERLKKIDGRAAVSIMSCRVDPQDRQLQAWLAEGLSIEVHTFDHPCPCLQDGGLVKAKETYDKCVDLMNEIPGNRPVAFRMPCCDSKNTPSPRFWAEVFNKTTAKGNFLQIDSSVFNVITSKDKELPKEITQLADGSDRFRRYIPFPNFVNTIEDYPYPYVIGGMCWEFPCVVPSDWSAQHVQKPNNPDTVRDWKLALDACVLKQGVFNLVFHPHGWIKAEQIVELIDHAQARHGKKVKFLTFKECAERLNANLLCGTPRRTAEGLPSIGAVIDADEDGYMDLLTTTPLPTDPTKRTFLQRFWDPAKRQWYVSDETLFHVVGRGPLEIVRDLDGDDSLERIGVDGTTGTAYVFAGAGLGIRGDQVSFDLPVKPSTRGVTGKLPELRLIDVNSDGKLDCLFSNHERYSLHLFKDIKEGWAIKVIDGVRGRAEGNIGPEIPPFVRGDGTNNGAWFHSGALWLQNEDSWRLPDHVFKLTFAEMLGQKESGVRGQESGGLIRRAAQVVAQQLSGPRPEELKMTQPRSPEESLKALYVRPGFKVELVAAEPLVVDPVAFDWGPDGRLWVVEMHDYPSGIGWKHEGDKFGEPGGRVKVLTDTDGDGKYDKAATFLDKLPFPTGVKVWRKGILVTAAPEILYAEDTNGDDKADLRKTLYQGFGEGNQQHRVNGLRWGLDNWLYVGNGDSGGVIKSLAALVTRRVSEGAEVNVNGRDLRIRPDTGEIDGQSGQTQFGRERDDWGNWFGGNNSYPMWHYTLEDHYLRRNGFFAPPSVRKQVSVSPGAAPVFPRSKTLARFNDFNMANRFTSACSQIIYRDNLLGPEFAGNMFVCEPVHNLVSREIVSPQGTTFTSRRAADEEQSEFLASEDNWFRPSMVRTGPDGALYVSDMYRFVIEHPKWIPPEFLKVVDVRAGDDKGRIYRIWHEDAKPRPIARLDKLDTAGLVAALDSPNGPQRDLAQQMLLWKADQGAVVPLTKLATASQRPQARLHALCTLDGLAGLTDELLIAAMNDAHPGVRRHAIRLSEPRLAASALVVQEVMRRADDPDPQVRMQVAYSLGAATCNSCGSKLGKLLVANQDDPYIVAASLSSIRPDSLGEVLATVMTADKGAASDQLRERLLTMAARMGDDKALNAALANMLNGPSLEFTSGRLMGLAAVLDSLERRKEAKPESLAESNRKKLAMLAGEWRKQIEQAHAAVSLDKLPQAAAAISLLGKGLNDNADDVRVLSSLLDAKTPPSLQAAAVAALARTGNTEVPTLLVAGWASHTPALRGQILDTLLGRDTWALALLDAVENGPIQASQVDARRRQQLATSRNAAVRTRAEKVLAVTSNSDRQQIIEQYLKAAGQHNADATRGKAVYAKRCANCHRLEGVGHAVGPDLAALNNRSRDVLFIAMLDPSRAVEDRYLDYVVRTVDGQTLTGMLREETGTSITLAAAEGKTATILRSDIERIQSSGKSLMPEGVEKDITPAEMADVTAYLATNAPPPKQLPGNRPEVVRPFVDGSIRLVATAARVYGPSIVLEERYRNLGWWSSEEDYAAWSFDGAEDREYRVVLDYACDQSAAGNSLVITIAGQTVGGVVTSTGSWDDYDDKDLGVVKLPAGAGELVVRSAGPIKSALLDLREVRLAPVRK